MILLGYRNDGERIRQLPDVTFGMCPPSIESVITRRRAILIGLGLPGALAIVPQEALASKEFWNEKMPSDWTSAEVQQLLNKSPWAKDASITDTGQRGPLSSARPAGRRSGRGAAGSGGTSAATGPSIKWKATVRWESALPVRTALTRSAPGALPDDYILNVLGNVPGIDSNSGGDALKNNTVLEHKGDEIKLNRIEPAPKNDLSAEGTLFYFSRVLALRLEDREVTFTTKLGPLDVKCKFALKDMLYQGKLEL